MKKPSEMLVSSRCTVTDEAYEAGKDNILHMEVERMREEIAHHIAVNHVKFKRDEVIRGWTANLRVLVMTEDEFDALMLARLRAMSNYERFAGGGFE